jgi:carboxypeptidase Q
MTRSRPRWALSAFALCVISSGAPLVAQGRGGAAAGPQETIDTAAIQKIKDEGFKRSQVMDLMSWLTDVYGPRLTGSPITKRAGDWTIEQFRKWGLANPHYEWWGPFGRGWVNDRMIAQVTAPVAFPVIGYPGAWSDGTNGLVNNDVILVPNTIQTAADFAPYRGKLKGKIVVSQPPRDLQPLMTAPGRRYTEEELNRMANPFPVAGTGGRGGRGGRGAGTPAPNPSTSPRVNLQQCLADEGVAAVLTPGGGNSHGGNVFVGGGGSRSVDAPRGIPQVTLTPEHYGRIYRILDKGMPVKMELDVKNTFYTTELNSFNIIAEIPGTDKADEVVMVGAHFDSWHSGTGATDNAAGSAVMMEAMRILKASGLPMRRTVRIGLWTGEEQGLIGSREYVTAHFADRNSMQTKPEHSKFSAYYNVDNGTGAIRGIYLQGNNAVGPIFSQWMRILNNDTISVGHIAPGNTGGTDHQSFDAVGLPGFQFIQDAVEYGSRTHHSSQDLYERIQPADMKHNAVAVAAFVYFTANRPELLPRKPQPQAVAGGGRAGQAVAGGRAGGGGRGGADAPVNACPKA